MPNVCVSGNQFSHGATTGVCTPTQPIVRINGQPVHVMGDVSTLHSTSSMDAHTGTIVASSGITRINGQAVAVIGDSLTCGGTMIDAQSIVSTE